MIFLGDTKQTVGKGKYIYQLVIGTGTANLQTSQEGLPFSPIPNGSFTASDTSVIELPYCEFKAGLTGDAQFSLSRTDT